MKCVSGAGLGVLPEPHHNPGGRRHNRLHHLGEERRPGRSHRLPKVTQPSSKLQNQALTLRLCVSTFHAQPPHPLASWSALFCHLPTGPLPGDWAPTCCFGGLRAAGVSLAQGLLTHREGAAGCRGDIGLQGNHSIVPKP